MRTVQQLKDSIDIVALISDYVKLKRNGANHTGLCPFHNEKTGSFTVSQAKQMYKCFGCGKSGDAIQFIVEQEKKTFIEAVELLARKYGIEVDTMNQKREFIKPVPRLEKLNKQYLDYFENVRKISNNTLLRMKITEAVEWMPKAQKEVPAVCFNYYRNEELLNIKFRSAGKDFKLAKDAEIIFYNIDGIKDEKTVIIVEGEVDLLSCIEAGIYNVVSVPNGTPPPDKQGNFNPKLEYLDNCWQDFQDKEKIIIATDNDYVGKLLREELGRRLGKERCYQIEYPEGCKDTNEVLVKHGPKTVKDMYARAFEWPLEGIVPMEEMEDIIDDWYENGYPPGSKANVDGFDELLSFVPGLTVITGIPGHGKDEFTNLLMASLSKYNQWTWGIADFEEPTPYLVTKLAEKFTGKAFGFRADPDHRMSRMQKDWAKKAVSQYFNFINIQQVDATIDGILAKATELVLRKGIKGLRINPWNCIEHKKSPGQSETEYVSECLTKITNWAHKYGVHVFLVAHPTKINKDEKTGKYYVPTLYNISGSAHFFNKAHNGISVYRNYNDDITEVYVQKVKWSWLGQIGWSSFKFDTNVRQYNFLTSSVVKPVMEAAA